MNDEEIKLTITLTKQERGMLLYALGYSVQALGDEERKNPQGWSPEMLLRLSTALGASTAT